MSNNVRKKNKVVAIPLETVAKSDYQHPPFSKAYRPFFEQLCRTFADVMPCTPEGWEDDFRRDGHPEREMAFWKTLGDFFEHFTQQGRGWDRGRKMELYDVLLRCMSAGPAFAFQAKLRLLSRSKVKQIVEYVTKETKGGGATVDCDTVSLSFQP